MTAGLEQTDEATGFTKRVIDWRTSQRGDLRRHSVPVGEVGKSSILATRYLLSVDAIAVEPGQKWHR